MIPYCVLASTKDGNKLKPEQSLFIAPGVQMVAGGILTVPGHISCLCGHYSKQMFDSIPYDDLEMLNTQGLQGHVDGISQSPCSVPLKHCISEPFLQFSAFGPI